MDESIFDKRNGTSRLLVMFVIFALGAIVLFFVWNGLQYYMLSEQSGDIYENTTDAVDTSLTKMSYDLRIVQISQEGDSVVLYIKNFMNGVVPPFDADDIRLEIDGVEKDVGFSGSCTEESMSSGGVCKLFVDGLGDFIPEVGKSKGLKLDMDGTLLTYNCDIYKQGENYC